MFDSYDPVAALPKSAEFLEALRAQFGNLGLAAAAYNAGPQRVRDWIAGRGGLPAETLRSGSAAIAAAVKARFGCDTTVLAADLEAARQAEYDSPSPALALAQVRRLDHHIATLTEMIRNPPQKGNA